MECIECGGKTRVLNSRNSGDPKNRSLIPNKYMSMANNFTFRDHKCFDCGHTFQSIQMSASNINRLVKTKLLEMIEGM